MFQKRVLIIGAARSGLAAARLALAHGAEVLLADDHLSLDELALRLDGLPVAVWTAPVLPADLDCVIPSPAVPPAHPLIVEALRTGVTVRSEVDFARGFFTGQVLAVTGSNGKTTTTLLAEAVLRGAGLAATACGNVGHPFSLVALQDPQPDWAVLEVSSYQLEMSCDLRVRLALLLNLSEDHLARHGDMTGYLAAKWRLTGQLTADGCVVVNGGDGLLAPQADTLDCRVLSFSSTGAAADATVADDGLWMGAADGVPFIASSESRLMGTHNLENMAAVLLAARDLGLDLDGVRQTMLDFAPVEHRIELVVERRGVRWFNDSKATNADSTAKALQGFDKGQVILIAGGEAKTDNYETVDALMLDRVRELITFGRDGHIIGDWFEGRLPVKRVITLGDAVHHAQTTARPGDVVLLSPMCASFDQFANYEDRGHRFKDLVANLPK